jgi:polar amino acid transport system substrate-binding protein
MNFGTPIEDRAAGDRRTVPKRVGVRHLALLLAVGLLAAACSDDSGGSAATTEAAEETTTTEGQSAAAACAADVELTTAGGLTVSVGAGGTPPFNTSPAGPVSYDGALAAAIADDLGVGADAVTYITGIDTQALLTTDDTAAALGIADADFAMSTLTVNDERDNAGGVDFVDYYGVDMVVLAPEGSPLGDAAAVEDLADATLGVPVPSIGSPRGANQTYVAEVIAPSTEAVVFTDDQYTDIGPYQTALDDGTVDAYVVDRLTGFDMIDNQGLDAAVVAALPESDAYEVERYGMAFAEGSPLVDCVADAVDALDSAGTTDEIEEEWLNDGGAIPTLTG